MKAKHSVVFDRAADYYDETRALPAEVQTKVVGLLTEELTGRGNCLEIGVGTGRFALPLSAAGIPLTGIDLSEPMMRRLVANAGGNSPVLLAQADATALPFRDGSFGGAFAVHVLHLIPDWKTAVRELVRVVKPGGVLLIDLGTSSSDQKDLESRLAVMAGKRLRVGVTDVEPLDEVLGEMGARKRALPEITFETTRPPSWFIKKLRQNQFSFTWSLNDYERENLALAVEEWATQRFGSLDQPATISSQIHWLAYDLAA